MSSSRSSSRLGEALEFEEDAFGAGDRFAGAGAIVEAGALGTDDAPTLEEVGAAGAAGMTGAGDKEFEAGKGATGAVGCLGVAKGGFVEFCSAKKAATAVAIAAKVAPTLAATSTFLYLISSFL